MILDFNKSALGQIGTDIPDALIVAANINNEAAVNRIATQTVDQFGILKSAISAADTLTIFSIKTLDEEVFRHRIMVNVTGACLFFPSVAKVMQEHCDNIVHIASIPNIASKTSYAAYACLKAAVIQLVRSLARELAPIKMLINAIGFALTRIPLTKNYLTDPVFPKDIISAISIRCPGEPKDLINNMLLLVGFEEKFTNEQTIYVFGVQTLV